MCGWRCGDFYQIESKGCWREILRQLWWMSWLQFTTCKHALHTCHISNPLAILRLCVGAVCLFCSPLPHFVPLLACNPPRITTFSVFQFQPLPLERGLMNVAHIRVTSEITPPFFPKKIHQAESASPRDVWFSTQGECLSQRPQMARYWWGVRRTEMCCFWSSYSLTDWAKTYVRCEKHQR